MFEGICFQFCILSFQGVDFLLHEELFVGYFFPHYFAHWLARVHHVSVHEASYLLPHWHSNIRINIVTILAEAFFQLFLSLSSLNHTIFNVLLVQQLQSLRSPQAHSLFHIANAWYLQFLHCLSHRRLYLLVNVL